MCRELFVETNVTGAHHLSSTGSSRLPLATLFFVPLRTDQWVRQTLPVPSLPYHVGKRLGHSPPLAAIYFTFFKLTGWAII